MAPATRRSQAAASVTKKAPARKRPSRKASHAEDDWLIDDATSTNGADDDADMKVSTRSHAPMASMREAANPLREMAERIGKEVEKFAITMDVFLESLPTTPNKYEAVRDVVAEFKKIADETVRNRKIGHEKELANQLRDEWVKQARLTTALGSSGQNPPLFANTSAITSVEADTVKDIRDWQQEADLWELFRIVLEVNYRPLHDAERLKQETDEELRKLGEPNRFSSDSELWQRFILVDNLAKERQLVKRWLEQTVEHQQTDLPNIVQELENKAGGKGIWSSGWLYTRERIKGEKRVRSWPSASDSVQPQIRRNDDNELLVTQLDPDAPFKHKRLLEKTDVLFERAIWTACWEMLRRGKSWKEVKAWCEERNEGWRAFALGETGERSDVISTKTWRRMCHIAANSGLSNDYEAAAFGLLGGDVAAVRKVARSLNDHIHAYNNGLLLRQYEQYVLQMWPNKFDSLPGHHLVDDTVRDPERAQHDIMQLIIRLRNSPQIPSDTLSPLNIIQSYLLAKEAESLIHTVGVALSEEDRRSGFEERMIARLEEGAALKQKLIETEVALNPRALRITAHISMLLAALRTETLDITESAAEENLVVSYIQQLRAAGKRDLIPLYAAQLSRNRQIVTLSDVLLDVSQPGEQQDLLNLMTNLYHFSVDEIFWEQLQWITDGLGPTPTQPIKILEPTGEKEYPGQRIIVDFLPKTIDDTDAKILRSLKWFMMLPGYWQLTFEALSMAMRRCLLGGRFACALRMTREFSYKEMSKHKTYQLIGKSIDLMDDTVPWPRSEGEFQKWENLQHQSQSYYDMEQLVLAIEALSKWAGEERPYVEQRPTPSPIPTGIKDAKQHVDDMMRPLLDGLLLDGGTDEEAVDFAKIRQAYLPEMVIAYNSVLHTAGNIYTRDCLLDSMDLSVKIAKEEAGLADVLVRAGRMKEMVESFAHSSKAILLLKGESAKVWKPKKGREGRDANIWDIGPQGESLAMAGNGTANGSVAV